MNNNLPSRKHPRLNTFDYSSSGAYFITICTQDRQCILSNFIKHELFPVKIKYTEYGKIAEEQLILLEKRYPSVKVDQYVIMPDHIHIILVIHDDKSEASFHPTVSDIVCTYKSLTTRECKKVGSIQKLFQTSFYEHIIRNHEDYIEISKYIQENPTHWYYNHSI